MNFYISILLFVFSSVSYSSTCEVLEFKDIELKQWVRPAQKVSEFFVVTKNNKILERFEDGDVFKFTKQQYRKLGICDSFISIIPRTSCTPLVSDNSYIIYKNNQVWFDSYDYKEDNIWEKLTTHLRYLKSKDECSEITPFKDTPQACQISVAHHQKNKCQTNCSLVLSVDENINQGEVDVLSTMFLHFSRYQYQGLISAWNFLYEENICENKKVKTVTCELRDNIIHVPQIANYKVNSEILRKMNELTQGNICNEWKNRREINIYSVSEREVEYFNFSIGKIPHRVMDMKEFKKFIQELKPKIAYSTPKSCSIKKSGNQYVVNRDNVSIYRTTNFKNSIKALLSLRKLNLCLN